MAKQDNIKEIIVKYKELSIKVQDARKLLDAVELRTKNITDKFTNNVNTEISKDNVIQIDQNTYNTSYDELQKLVNNFYNDKGSQDNKNIMDMLTEYEKITDKITVCYNYLKTQKYEIINLD